MPFLLFQAIILIFGYYRRNCLFVHCARAHYIGYSYRRRQSWIEPQTEDRLATLLFCEEEKKYRDGNIVKPSTNIENGRERITSLALDLRWKTTVNYQSQGFRMQECFSKLL